MDVDKSVRVNGVFDPSFVTGSGLAETLAGFANTSGKEIIRGFSNSAASRIDGWVRRQEVGTSAGRKTWHDKLSVFKVREADGSLWYYIKVGSANLTDHSAENSEIQFFMRLPEHSRLARWFLVSVKGHLQLHPERFAPIDREAIRVNVARFLGVPAGSLTLETLTQIEQQLDANQYGLLGQTLLHAWQDVDANERKISSGEIRRRLRMFHVFLKWYARNVWPQKYYKGDPPMRLPLITDAKDWVLDRILPGRTKLRMQQIGTAFKMIAERDRAGAENLQIQRLIYSMSPDEHFSTEHVQMLVKQLLRDLKIKGNFRALTSQDIEDNLNWNEKPISVSCQVHLGSAQDGT